MRCSFNGSCKTKTMAAILFLAAGLLFAGCDKGKKPYEEAEALFNKSDYAAAKSKAAEVIQNAPQSEYLAQAKALYEKVGKIEGLFKSASEAAKNREYNKAIKNYEEVLALDSKSPKATKWLQKSKHLQDAKMFEERGEYRNAEEAYKEILAFLSNDVDANEGLSFIEEYKYPSCCRSEIDKYDATKKSLYGIQDIFSQEPSSEDVFERKREAERINEQKTAISRDLFFFDIGGKDHTLRFDIGKYDFRKQEYKISFGVEKGTTGGEAYGIPSTPDVLQIANDKGERIVYHIKMNETDAELFNKEKENVKLFIIYKFVKGERFTYFNPLTAVAMQQMGVRGASGYEKDTRIYIKPIYVALLSGNKKITLYEARE